MYEKKKKKEQQQLLLLKRTIWISVFGFNDLNKAWKIQGFYFFSCSLKFWSDLLEGTKQSKAEDDLGGGGEGWYFLESIDDFFFFFFFRINGLILFKESIDNRIQINSISFKIQLILEGKLYFVWSSFRFNRNEFLNQKKKVC